MKYFVLLLILILLANCSFDHKTGIWSGSEKEKRRIDELQREQNKTIEIVKVYTSENFYTEEIPVSKNIILSKPIKNISWETSNFNTQNKVANLYLPSITNNFLKKKIGKNKFFSSNTFSPLSIEKNIIFSDDTGNIFNINSRGKINWKKNIYKKIYKKLNKNLSLTIYKNKIYVADNIGFIYSLDLKSGEINWIKNHGIPFKSKIKIFDDKIFLINQDNKIICLDIERGKKIWDIRSISTFIKSQSFLGMAISNSGFVVALTSSGDLIKAQSDNGRIYWTLNTTASLFADSGDFFKSSDVVIVGDDIIISTLTSIFSFDLRDGLLNWEKEIGTTNNSIIDGKYIFLVLNNGYFINLDRESGKIISSINILKTIKKKKQNTQVTGFVLGSNKIYATTLNGYLIVCSAITGNIEYVKKIGNSITAPPIISNGSLYVLTEKSKILGFN